MHPPFQQAIQLTVVYVCFWSCLGVGIDEADELGNVFSILGPYRIAVSEGCGVMPHDNDHGKVSILQSVAGAICGVVVVGKSRSPICTVGRGCIENESMFSRDLVKPCVLFVPCCLPASTRCGLSAGGRRSRRCNRCAEDRCSGSNMRQE